MAYDGSLKFDTKLDGSGLESGISKVTKLVATGAAAVGAALVGAGVAALKVGSDFEAGMSQVAATLGTTVDKIPEMTAIAKEMGAATQYSATQAAEALNFLAQAGYESEKAIAVLPTVLNLAASDSMELGYAAQLVTDSMAVLGLEMQDMSLFTDMLAVAAQKSNASVSQMGEAVLIAGGQAKLAQMSVVDMNTALGILADNGIKGSEGGTALRNTLKNLYTPTSAAADAMMGLGLATENADGTLRSAQDVLQDLAGKLDNLTEAERIKAMSQIFDTRTIAAANALLKDSGARWSELASEIENAEGAAAKMAETMIDNLKGDIIILGSALEGLGIQIYEGFNEPLRQAAQEGTRAVDRLASALNKPEMQRAIQAIAQGFSNLVQEIAKFAEKWIPILVQGLANLINGTSPLIPLLSGVAAGFAAFEIVSTISKTMSTWNTVLAGSSATLALLNAGQVAAAVSTSGLTLAQTAQAAITGVLTGQITIATAAQWLWNAAMAANPAGLVAIAIGLLVAGVAALVVGIRNAIPDVSYLTEEFYGQIDALDELTEKSKQSADAYKTTLAGVDDQAAVARKLAAEIQALAGVFDGSQSQALKLNDKIAQFNQLVPHASLSFNELTGELNMTSEAIEQQISDWEALSKAQAAQDRVIELQKESLDLELQMQAVKRERDNAVDQAEIIRLENIVKYGSEASEVYWDNLEALGAYNAAVDAANTTLSEAEAQLQLNAEQVEYLGETYISTAEAVEESKEYFDMSEVAASMGMSVEEYIAYQDLLIEKTKELEKNFQDVYDNIAGTVTNAFSTMSEGAVVPLNDMIANLQKNQELTQQWAEGLAYLAEVGLSNGLLQQLRDAGPEGYAQVVALAEEVKKGDGEISGALDTLNATFEAGVGMIPDTFETAFEGSDIAGMATDWIGALQTELENLTKIENYEKYGENIPTGVTKGVEAKSGDAVKAIETTAKEMDDGFKGYYDIKSPSGLMEKHGENIVLGLANGVENSVDKATQAIETLCESTNTAAKNKITSLDFTSLGQFIAQGIATGISNGTSVVESAIRNVIGAALTAAQQAADSHSPARKFMPLGANIDEGVAVGMERAKFTQEAAEGIIAKAQAAIDTNHANLAAPHSYASTVTNTSTTNEGGQSIEINISVEGDSVQNIASAKRIGQEIGREAEREMRRRGVFSLA